MRRPLAFRFSAMLLSALLLGSAAPRPLAGEAPANVPEGGRLPPASADAPSPPATPGDAPRYRLAYRFLPGETLRYEVRHRSRTEVRKGEAKQTVVDQTITDKHVRVVSVAEDGSAVLEPIIDRVRMTVQFDEADPILFDSDDPAAAPRQFQDVYRHVGKRTAHMHVTPHGALRAITRFDGDVKPLALKKDDPEVPADEDDSARLPEGPAIEESEENVAEARADENVLVLLPEGPVAVGDVWKERYPVQVKVDRNIERTAVFQREFRLQRVEGSVATIGVKIAIITPILDPAILAQLVHRTPAGTVSFDIERGEILSRSLEHEQTIFGAIGPTSSLRASSKLRERRVHSEQTAASADDRPRS